MSLPTPFYEQDGITIYHGDNRRIVPLLDEFDLLLTDPPYGIDITKSNRISTSRGFGGSDWDKSTPPKWFIDSCSDIAPRQIIWGGNYFHLPPARCFLIWDKENEGRDFADCEMAWTNFDAVARIYRKRPMNMDGGKVHPTQKPVDLMTWCLNKAPDAQTVLDPWMGSGTTLVAAKLRGMKAVGIEINKDYCDAAVARLSQGVLLPC